MPATPERVNRAPKILAVLGRDGTVLRPDWREALRAAGGECAIRHGDIRVWKLARHHVVVVGGAWDLRAPRCKRWCWAGAGCTCTAERRVLAKRMRKAARKAAKYRLEGLIETATGYDRAIDAIYQEAALAQFDEDFLVTAEERGRQEGGR